ncbi:MAG TPA: hypothetical protein VN323_20410, partial [Candidatus Dormibacteraeota bacterium]|nr:hypothetical protein [Candidatus Dormibacteraeota bacterium]
MQSTVGSDVPPLALGPGIPGLIVSDRVQPTAGLPDRLAPGVEVCRDARGDLLAYCCAENGALRVDLPDLASFSYARGASHVRAMPHRPLSHEFILDTYHHCVLPLILPALGTEVLHASAVIGAAGVAAFCGPSGTGKSTIAVALARRGYSLWADDAVAVDTDASVPTAIRLPFTVRLRSDSARLLGAERERQPAATAAPVDRQPATLAVLCMLRRTPDATTTVVVERLEAASTLRTALTHAYCFSVKDSAQKRR